MNHTFNSRYFFELSKVDTVVTALTTAKAGTAERPDRP